VGLLSWTDSDMRKIPRDMADAPLKDYGPAVRRAIAWLGDRYLLAHPVNVVARRRAGSRPFEVGPVDPSSCAAGASLEG